ncbi:MFS transporter [Nonomuraea muscovyensis]|uniref:DHA2 family multidrug resistance protein-like MFS transporter n=1 Tax=Nonomuraea muscovyensis TaxID=1124761 RepID=A0A7X0CDR5_9ACTN|nr:MFS transporter [Nonomuraea muscovyensis]MBB6351449.1 DHA2 family multidrug resistance protein-like MFS transporter [Nonomuraea muscovyensis]
MNGAPPKAGRKEWLGLAVLALPVLLISITVTVLYFAVPFLSVDLRPSGAQLLWIVDIYAFLLAGLLIAMGSLGDRIGRRKLLLWGATAFGLTSAAAAYAPTPELLIAARALQGAAAATLMPPTLALIRNMFHDAAQRRLAVAVWAASFAGGSVLGPIVGGWLLERLWWGAVFLINVPIMVLLLVLGPLLLPEYRDPQPGRFDLWSAVLSLAAVLPVVYGVKQVAGGGAVLEVAGAVVVGLAFGLAFVRRQRTLADPMLDLRLFRDRSFGVSLLTDTLAIFALVGVFYFVSQYLQMVLGLRPFVAGLLTLPAAVMALVGALSAAALVKWFRPGLTIAAGMLVACAGFVVLAQVGPGSHQAILVLGLALLGAGIGVVQALASDLVVAVAPPERAGSASAVLEAATELGGALGVAVLGSMGLAVYRSVFEAPQGLSPDVARVAGETLGGAAGVAGDLPDALAAAVLESAREAFTTGMRVSALVAAVILGLAAVLTALTLRRLSLDMTHAGDRTAGP